MRLAGIVLIGLAAGFPCASAHAQTADGKPAFEVASIKPGARAIVAGLRMGMKGGPGSNDPGLYACDNCGLSLLVTQAYDIKYYQLSAPSWMDTERFNISAKVPDGATKEQFYLMLQNLLAERFKLIIHRDQKEMQVCDLVVVKGGSKLKQSVDKPPAQEVVGNPQLSVVDGKPVLDKDGFLVRPPGPNPPKGRVEVGMGGKGRIRAEGETMQDLSERLSSVLAKPVIDATGLKGTYDYSLIFDLPAAMGGRRNTTLAPAGGSDANNPLGAASDDTGTPIESAIQSQLGLKLVSKKGPVDIIVIDHVEKVPTEN